MNVFFLLIITFTFKIGTVVMRRLRCFSYCINPYKGYTGLTDECNELQERNVVICEDNYWWNYQYPTCYLEIIGESVYFGCSTDGSAIQRCHDDAKKGYSVCYSCREDYCNSKEKAKEIAEKSQPLGVSKCYKDKKGKNEVKICLNHINTYYECMSLVETHTNGSVHKTKTCVKTNSTEENDKALMNKCKKAKTSCYLCKTDLCNYYDRQSDNISLRADNGSNHLTVTCNPFLFSLLAVMYILCKKLIKL